MDRHLSGYTFLIFNLKDYTENQAEMVAAKGLPNLLQLVAHLHQAKKTILAALFEVSGPNPGAGLELMICILKLK